MNYKIKLISEEEALRKKYCAIEWADRKVEMAYVYEDKHYNRLFIKTDHGLYSTARDQNKREPNNWFRFWSYMPTKKLRFETKCE